MSKHTPGQWEAAARCNAVYAGAQCVANLTEVTTGVEAEEGRANAMLVAAAPDLLAALHAVADYYDGMGPVLGDSQVAHGERRTRAIVRSAIAKAEGSTP